MGCFRYALPTDEVGHLATVTNSVNTEDAQYPASRLCNWTNEYEDVPARANAAGAVDWLLDLGSARRIDWIVLWHSFDAAIDVRFKMGSTTATSDMNAGVTIPADTADGFSVKVHKDLTGVSGYSAGGYRYAKLSVPSSAAAAGAKLLCFSTARTFNRRVRLGPRQPNRHNAIVHPTDFAKVWAYDLPAARRGFSFHIDPDPADLIAVRTWFQACGGPVLPTAMALDADVNDALIARWSPGGTDGFIQASLDIGLHTLAPDTHSVDCAFDELSAGLPEWT